MRKGLERGEGIGAAGEISFSARVHLVKLTALADGVQAKIAQPSGKSVLVHIASQFGLWLWIPGSMLRIAPE